MGDFNIVRGFWPSHGNEIKQTLSSPPPPRKKTGPRKTPVLISKARDIGICKSVGIRKNKTKTQFYYSIAHRTICHPRNQLSKASFHTE